MIRVFTKYEEFRIDTIFRLEDQGLDTCTDAALLNAEVDKIFNETYLDKLRESTPFVRLESECFI